MRIAIAATSIDPVQQSIKARALHATTSHTQICKVSVIAQRYASQLAPSEIVSLASPSARLQEQVAHWYRRISTSTITTEVVKSPVL